jgi:hypothetical protein
LTKDGPVNEKKISYAIIDDTLRAVRPELRFCRIEGNTEFLQKVSAGDVAYFYDMLYRGRMVHLQNSDSLWQAIGSDYLLVFYLRYGLSMNTFDHVDRKRARIEAELWDCTEPEVVWRASADGWCSHKNISDVRFLAHGIGRIISGLPALTPSYDQNTW